MMGLQDAASGLQRRLRSSSSLLWATPLGFNPATLFGPTNTGWFYDLYDRSTLFQDAAGTIPVTAVNQPVGLCLDKSGRGNHRSQSASLPRPTYARHPLGGIRNLLTFTEEFDNAVWVKSGLGVALAPTVTANFAPSPLGDISAERVQFSLNGGAASTDQSLLRQTLFGLSTVDNFAFSFYARATDGVSSYEMIFFGKPAASQRIIVTGQWQRFVVSGAGTNANYSLMLRGGQTPTNSNTADILIWGAQLELGSTATAYQRVVSRFDVTEAGQPDLYYLAYDGSDDCLSTAPFAWGTDKATVVAGVRKLSDAAPGVLAELSTDSETTKGSIGLAVPGSSTRFIAISRGTATQTASTTNAAYNAPTTRVVTVLSSIAPANLVLRLDGMQVGANTVTQGNGNFGTHQAFFGARAGTSAFFNGREYSNFAINRLLTANELAQIERYTAQRTGVTIP